MKKIILNAVFKGIIASLILLGAYFLILTLVSGWDFAVDQFLDYWYFVLSLAFGFGIQVGLFVYLKNAVHSKNLSKGVLAATGTTSTVAMISCCAHYLVNILPVLGVTGLVTFVAQYQMELFGLGLLSNLLGIAYILRRIYFFHKSQSHDI
ncbi:hypothetical protein CO046_03700 [Candidatus Peregrinibacteria bacterium CG_4_9_14_0_2_um_filter_53_11]|nr:MAG: hypothetical protein CO046_03700 [Candidatus Peregrinibacteria bacterium CG_4_9_14_0_2_um_filter_53_11]